MIEPELIINFGYVFLIGGIILIIISAYMWYLQREKRELMKLEL